MYDSHDVNNQSSRLNHGSRSQPGSSGGCLIFLVLTAVISAAILSSPLSQLDDALPPAIQVAFIPLLCAGVCGLVVLFATLLQKIFKRSAFGRFFGGISGLLFKLCVSVVIIVEVAWSLFINPYVSMTHTRFTRTSIHLSIGGILHFQNPNDGVPQMLCLGIDQKCEAYETAPEELNRGILIKPGQTIAITFHENGTYWITSKSTAHMNMVIYVTSRRN